MINSIDVLILGGGPAGASAGISLADKGYSVAMVEKTNYSATRIGETISPFCSKYLRELKIADNFFECHVPSYHNQSFWGNDFSGENNFFYHPYGNGWHLNRSKFDSQLFWLAETRGSIVFKNSTISFLSEKRNYWSVKINQHKKEILVRAKFIIDATGRSASFVKLQRGKKIVTDHLIAVAGYDEIDSDNCNLTLIEAVRDGWWYSADLPDKKIIAAFMTDADLLRKNNTNQLNFYHRQLMQSQATKKRSRSFTDVKLFAANSYLTNKRSGTKWLAIGDAAMAYDPLSSMGIQKALNDGIESATVIDCYFNGDQNAIKKFDQNYEKRFLKYLENRKYYYRLENRWKSSVFWNRRQ